MQYNFQGTGHPEPGFSGFPDSCCFCAVDSCGKSIECPCGTGMAIASHNHHARAGIPAHQLVANTLACIVKTLDTLTSCEISDMKVIIGQLTVGGRGIVIEHNDQLVGFINKLTTHLSKSAFNAGRIVVTQYQVGSAKYNSSCRCPQDRK